jgi:hypothetical protein
MIDLLIAAALAQAADPCLAIDAGTTRPPGCPAWRPLFQDQGTMAFVDPASVRRSGDTFEILQRATFPELRNGAASVTVLYRVDCGRRTLTGVRAFFYDPRGIRLREYRPTGANAEPTAIPPGAPFDRIRAEFCPG